MTICINRMNGTWDIRDITRTMSRRVPGGTRAPSLYRRGVSCPDVPCLEALA
jgi:hypothetical protein